ncbi:hypothetical protein FVF58_45070 [Paraburkholderia panacisoli]|uniref:Uncharacterized protein n=1 Tax=Paraburkholderia panacisoli TaxID=2603818 RepID=A0A5B0G6Y1_9BURK|nr:hypothetical protein [Paraburkholderia panacisoli]KAA0998351.1 hypothetical protein FVF58_45070 [Paraburkholderia panacisoli]
MALLESRKTMSIGFPAQSSLHWIERLMRVGMRQTHLQSRLWSHGGYFPARIVPPMATPRELQMARY